MNKPDRFLPYGSWKAFFALLSAFSFGLAYVLWVIDPWYVPFIKGKYVFLGISMISALIASIIWMRERKNIKFLQIPGWILIITSIRLMIAGYDFTLPTPQSEACFENYAFWAWTCYMSFSIFCVAVKVWLEKKDYFKQRYDFVVKWIFD